MKIVVCPFVPFLLVIVLSILLLFTASDYLFGIFKHFCYKIVNTQINLKKRNRLTEANPKIIRRTYTKTIDVRAHTGIRIVAMPHSIIEIPMTRLPPNLPAIHPPGICVKMYP